MTERLSCNSCSKPMRLTLEGKKATCECGQIAGIDDRGEGYMTILPRLYPCRMTDPKMLREFGEYQASEHRFFNQLRYCLNLIDEAELSARSANTDAALARFIKDNVLPLEAKHSWWRFWERA